MASGKAMRALGVAAVVLICALVLHVGHAQELRQVEAAGRRSAKASACVASGGDWHAAWQRCAKLPGEATFQWKSKKQWSCRAVHSGKESTDCSHVTMLQVGEGTTPPTCNTAYPVPAGATWSWTDGGWQDMACPNGNGDLTTAKFRECTCVNWNTDSNGEKNNPECTVGMDTNVAYKADFIAGRDSGVDSTTSDETTTKMNDCYHKFVIDREAGMAASLPSTRKRRLGASGSKARGSQAGPAFCPKQAPIYMLPCWHCAESDTVCQAQHCQSWALPAGHVLASCSPGAGNLNCGPLIVLSTGSFGCSTTGDKLCAHFYRKIQASFPPNDCFSERFGNLLIAQIDQTNLATFPWVTYGRPYGIKPADLSGCVHIKVSHVQCGTYSMLLRLTRLPLTGANFGRIPSHKKLVWGNAAGHIETTTTGCPTYLQWDHMVREFFAEQRSKIAKVMANALISNDVDSDVENALGHRPRA